MKSTWLPSFLPLTKLNKGNTRRRIFTYQCHTKIIKVSLEMI